MTQATRQVSLGNITLREKPVTEATYYMGPFTHRVQSKQIQRQEADSGCQGLGNSKWGEDSNNSSRAEGLWLG